MRPFCRPAPFVSGAAEIGGRAIVAAALLFAAPAAVGQQSNPSDFTLPEPSPAPSVQPEGPADERAGVPIPPRVIPQERRVPPQELPARTLPLPSASPAAPIAQPPGPSRGAAAASPAPNSGFSSLRDADRRSPPISLDEAQSPDGEGFLVGEDEWVDVGPALDDIDAGATLPGAEAIVPAAPPPERPMLISQTWLWALVALLIGVLAGLVGLARRSQRVPEAKTGPDGDLARGVRETIRARPADPGLARALSPPAARRSEPARPLAPSDYVPDPAERMAIELSLEIVRATRSVMMFTLEYRLTLWNRSERAVRDLRLDAGLVCAKRAGANGFPAWSDPPLATIERIGPHQRRTISATTQLPLSHVEAMHQGAKPLFVPLLHIGIKGPGGPAIARAFVIGSPSQAGPGAAGVAQAGTARLHPIPLDTPPGGINGLRASEISHQSLSEPA